MGQQTYANGESNASVRSKLNGNAQDAVSKENGGDITGGNSIGFFDSDGNKKGDLKAETDALRMTARDSAGNEEVAVLKGATVVLQGELVGLQQQGAKPGNFVQLLGEYDVEGDKIYQLGSSPLDVAAYSEEFSNSSNVVVDDTAAGTVVVSGTLVNNYTNPRAVGNAFCRIENSSNSDILLEAWITADGAAPDPGDIFEFIVPRQSGGAPGISFVSFNDTADTNINAGQALELRCRTAVAGTVLAAGATIPSTVKIQENTDIGALYLEAIAAVNAQSGSPTVETPNPADLLIYYPVAGGEAKVTRIRDMFGANIVDAFVRGETTNLVATSTPAAIDIFDTDFYTSATGLLVDSGDNTGMTTNAPLRYKVKATFSYEGSNNADFVFQIYAGGVPIGRQVTAAGGGSGVRRNFSIQAVTGLLLALDKIEIRLSNNGDTLNFISGDIIVEFAGVD